MSPLVAASWWMSPCVPPWAFVDEFEYIFEERDNFCPRNRVVLAFASVGAGAFKYCRYFRLDFATVGAWVWVPLPNLWPIRPGGRVSDHHSDRARAGD